MVLFHTTVKSYALLLLATKKILLLFYKKVMNHYFYKFTKFTNGYFLYKKDMNHYIVNRKDKILKSVVLTCWEIPMAWNLLVGFLRESLVFCEKMSEWVICSKKRAIRSFLVSDLSNSLMVTHSWWATWANRSWSLIFGERTAQLAHIAHF